MLGQRILGAILQAFQSLSHLHHLSCLNISLIFVFFGHNKPCFKAQYKPDHDPHLSQSEERQDLNLSRAQNVDGDDVVNDGKKTIWNGNKLTYDEEHDDDNIN